MIKVVAFDLDDTLWPVKPVIISAEKTLGAWLANEVPQFDYSSVKSLREEVFAENPEYAFRLTAFRHRLIEVALERSGVTDASNLAARAMEVFLDARNNVNFFPGALGALTKIREAYQLGALTNGNADIGRLGLDHLFSFAFSAETVGAPKPAPTLFIKALEHTGVSAEQMIYVGDDPDKDVDAASKCGLKTIWMQTEARPGPPESIPDAVITEISDLPEAVAQIDSQ